MSAGGLARQRSLSSRSNPLPTQFASSKGKEAAVEQSFQPCAATASILLFSQASTILCLHHDTLAIDRRFQRHVEDISFISVDNVSERGAGRLVVSYDVGKTAIVWDLFSGDQLASFASFEPIKAAAWMRNGNIAFGNVKGEVILFEPSSSEHVSARTIFDPITAIAPSTDCKTFAIGYNNGSILLAALQPTFTILHTLTTSRAPSPIESLMWHASSSKQKSDMLATQTTDGDLRVWSVAKPATADNPRVIRVLERSESFLPGRNWMTWSKNGRIIQYSEGETWSWDVRTKHMTYEPVKTVEHTKGIAAYGPTATLFTLGPNFTVQQYDLETKSMVANVQHLPHEIPPTPPEDRHLGFTTSESEDDFVEPVGQLNAEMAALEAARIDRNQSDSPRSHRSRTASDSSHTSGARNRFVDIGSPAGRTERSGTTFLTTQSRDAKMANQPPRTQSPVSTRASKKGSRLRQEVINSPQDNKVQDLFPYTRARLNDIPYRPARPADESHLTPDDLRRQMLSVVFGWEQDIRDLIREEKSRHPVGSQNAVLLSKWLDDDPEELAMMMGASSSPSALDWMLFALSGPGNQANTKKVGQTFVEKMLNNGDIHSAAIILLSLGDRDDAIEVYVSRNYFMEAILLTCLLMPTDWQRQSYLVRRWGEHVVENSQQHLAIRCFSCIGVEPSEPWTSPSAQMATSLPEPLQAETYKAEPYQPESFKPGQLATIPQRGPLKRIFNETPTPTAMPAPQTTFDSSAQAARMTAKNSTLKLITSFGPQREIQFKFPGLKSDDRTPTNAPGITPIAESAMGESALSPGGLGSYRLNNVRSLTGALSARAATPKGYKKQRLPSIGETPIDVNPPSLPGHGPKRLPTPADSGSDKERDQVKPVTGLPSEAQDQEPIKNPPILLLSSARYDPNSTPQRETPLTALPPSTTLRHQSHDRPHSSTTETTEATTEDFRPRTGSRSRKPDGLSIQMVPVTESPAHDFPNISTHTTRSRRAPSTTSSYPTQIDTQSELTSPITTASSYKSLKSPSVSGRSLDQYISSLEQAQYYSKHFRTHGEGSIDTSTRSEHTERKRSRHRRAPSEDARGRSNRRVIPASKRSPSSPVPMSPEDVNLYSASVESFDSIYHSRSDATTGKGYPLSDQNKEARRKKKSSSQVDEGRRPRSRSRHLDSKSKSSSRAASRRTSPEPPLEPFTRGRSKSKQSRSAPRSPSSPFPMGPSGEDLRKGATASPALRLVSSDRQRLQRSVSRRVDRSPSARRERSPDRLAAGSRSQSRPDKEARLGRKSSMSSRNDQRRHRNQSSNRADAGEQQGNSAPDVGSYFVYPVSAAPEPGMEQPRKLQTLMDRTKKELAAAELEARRLSLARRPSAPAIPLPGQVSHSKSASLGMNQPPFRSYADTNPQTTYGSPSTSRAPERISPGSDSGSSGKELGNNVRRGLPGTPRAMRHPLQSQDPSIPDVPDNFITLSSDVYRPEVNDDIQRSISAPPLPNLINAAVPMDLPKHPAFDHRLPTSRGSSRGPDRSFSPSVRAPSRERAAQREFNMASRDALLVTIGENDNAVHSTEMPPPILPELQHLATPPPPPPPPPPPTMPQHYAVIHSPTTNLNSRLQNEFGASTSPLPQTTFSQSNSTTPYNHRRGRSANENLVGKIRAIADRMRSSSRGREARSPPIADDTPSPYESIPHNTHRPATAGVA